MSPPAQTQGTGCPAGARTGPSCRREPLEEPKGILRSLAGIGPGPRDRSVQLGGLGHPPRGRARAESARSAWAWPGPGPRGRVQISRPAGSARQLVHRASTNRDTWRQVVGCLGFSSPEKRRRVPKRLERRYPLRLAAWANNSVGRVPCSQRGSRWFEPSLAHHSPPPSPGLNRPEGMTRAEPRRGAQHDRESTGVARSARRVP